MATGSASVTSNTSSFLTDAAVELYEQLDSPSPDVLHGLIYEYLIHNCYKESAAALDKSCQISENRRRIWSKKSHTAFSSSRGGNPNTMDLDQAGTDSQQHMDLDEDMLVIESKSGTIAAGGLGGADVLEGALSTMETRKMLTGLILDGKVADVIQICNTKYPTLLSMEHPDSLAVNFTLQCQLFIEHIRHSAPDALAFAQEELGKFAFMQNKEFSNTLQDIIALIAYTDPDTSPLASYMSQERRIQVADQLNSHILAHHGHSSQPTLTRIVKQATVLRDYIHSDSSKDKKGSNNKVVYPKWDLSSFIDS